MLYVTGQKGREIVRKQKGKDKGFRGILVLMALLLVAAGWWFVPRVYSLAVVGYQIQYKLVVVKEGDTLWSIAQSQLEEGKDPRKLIYEIRSINRLQSAIVRPGDFLRVPAAGM